MFDTFVGEMENQVGLEDRTGTGVALDLTCAGCEVRFYGGFKKELRIKTDKKGFSKEEWLLSANDCIDLLLAEHGARFEVSTLNMNGFSIEEIENEN